MSNIVLDRIIEEFCKSKYCADLVAGFKNKSKLDKVRMLVDENKRTVPGKNNIRAGKVLDSFKDRCLNGTTFDEVNVVDYIATILLKTLMADEPKQKVRQQHWIPKSYLAGFKITNQSLFQTSYSNGYRIDHIITDKGFIVENFHDQLLETFYMYVEQGYGANKGAANKPYHKAAVTLFFITMYFRHPSNNYRNFNKFFSDLEDFVSGKEFFETTVMSPRIVGFTDYMPYKDFGGVWVFPMNPDTVSIISDHPVVYPTQYVEKYMDTLLTEVKAGKRNMYHDGNDHIMKQLS